LDHKGEEVNELAKRIHREEGFTLIELMIVILIIGILVGIAVPVFLAARGSAEEKTCLANQRNFLAGVDIYASANEEYPATEAIWTATGDTYFQGNLPDCPGAGVITTGAWGVDSRPTVVCDVHGTPGG
jgi:prepilin-type N-terminal cleavage/methylation domain-containing protein